MPYKDRDQSNRLVKLVAKGSEAPECAQLGRTCLQRVLRDNQNEKFPPNINFANKMRISIPDVDGKVP